MSSDVCPLCEEAPRTLRGDLRVATLQCVIEDNNRLRGLIRDLNNGKPCCPREDFDNDGPEAVCYICRCYFGMSPPPRQGEEK